ncbi:MAG: penicillin acylase family protein [Gemmatimonadota bacterium]|nr:penicillin acylase family protein [Gemmatimonadota bacterium]
MSVSLLLSLLAFQAADSGAALPDRVEIVRTEYGVPHIMAEDLEAMGFGLAYVQSEDFGASVATGLVQSRGTLARYEGRAEIDSDFVARALHARAVETFHRLDVRTRDVYEGFAQGLNYYIRLHPDEFPSWMTPNFTGVDAHARDVQTWSRGDAARFVRELQREGGAPREPDPDEDLSFALDGSNAWAFDGTRTTSGKAILLRNPHLTWGRNEPLLTRLLGSTYYEAHVRVPGVLEFYGDFRIGGAFGIIGGFNRDLGWATTNNYPTYSQVYALAAHPTLENHAILDGEPLALTERTTTVDYSTARGGSAAESRSTWWTEYGPVIHRTPERIYLLKDPRDGEFRRGEQFLMMMMSTSLDEWLDVMHMRAHPSSNFTYADARGNIAHYYNARLPLLPHATTGDSAAFAASSADIWSELVPWTDLPLYLNPPGGYVQQANDTPDFTNLNVPLDRDTVAANLPEPRLRLRSQLSLDLVHNDRVFSLEDVIEQKHSPRMLMAERVMDDLLAAGRQAAPSALERALAVLAAWDRTADAESRGGVLFKRWAEIYFANEDTTALWDQGWDPARPSATPFGLGSDADAVSALGRAVGSLERDGISIDARWGDVHRVVRGDVDEPVSGCEPTLGCFRALSYERAPDGRYLANRGDAWVLLVEFGEVPRAYTVLAYGQTARNDSPHFDDQAALFARGEMKSVAWTEEDIARNTIRKYRPGGDVRR